MDDPNYINSFFFHKLKLLGIRKVLEWCRSIGLLASEYKCPKCSKVMRLMERKDLSDGFEWRCRQNDGASVHDHKRSIRTGSYFSSSRLSIIEILLITYYWIHQVPNEYISFELKTSSQTLADWKNYCREVCVDICENESAQVGGDGSIVEIFEGQFGELKNGRDKRVTGRWVYGGLVKKTWNFFFKVVDYPGKEEFLNVVEAYILPQTTVVSECCSAYKCMKDEHFQRIAKKHNLIFRTHDSKSNFFLKSNPVNKKRRIARRVGDKEERDFSGYFIAEYFWQKKYGTDSMLLFLNHIKRIYPPETEDSFTISTSNKNEHANELYPSTSSDSTTFKFGIDEE